MWLSLCFPFGPNSLPGYRPESISGQSGLDPGTLSSSQAPACVPPRSSSGSSVCGLDVLNLFPKPDPHVIASSYPSMCGTCLPSPFTLLRPPNYSWDLVSTPAPSQCPSNMEQRATPWGSRNLGSVSLLDGDDRLNRHSWPQMPLGEKTEWTQETWPGRTGQGDSRIGPAGAPVKSGPGTGGS